MMRGKKANAAAIILVILIIIILIGWWATVANRECSTDSDCGEGRYCDSGYRCRQVPVIEKTVVIHDYTKAALILGIAIVLAAFIWNPEIVKKIKGWLRRS